MNIGIVYLKVNYPNGSDPNCHSAVMHIFQQWEICKKGEENLSIEVEWFGEKLPIGHKFPIGTNPGKYFYWKVKRYLTP